MGVSNDKQHSTRWSRSFNLYITPGEHTIPCERVRSGAARDVEDCVCRDLARLHVEKEVVNMMDALNETLRFFIKWRLLSPKFWLLVVASYAYLYAVFHDFDAPRLAVVGASVLGTLAGHVWGQKFEPGASK